MGHADVATTMIHTHVLNRQNTGTRGALIPADRLRTMQTALPAKSGCGTETVRESSDIEIPGNEQPEPREEVALRSANHGLRGYWTEPVRLFGSDRSMNE